MGNNVREEIMDLDLNQEPLESSHGSMLGLGSLLNELETTHGRIEERIRQLEAVTSRARQRQRWRQGQTTPQIMNISSETLTVNVHNEGSLLTEEAGIGPQESSAENGKISKRDRTHLIAKALGMDTDVKKGGKDSSGFFDCNICLDMARDPILTCCGHLFCWPCFYQLSCAYSNVKECPVCNGEVTDASIIPIYGNGGNNSTHKSKSEESVLKVPPRPHAQRIESVRQQLINQGAFSAPIEESIQQLRSIIGAMGERTRSQDLDGARITSERSNFLTNHYRTSQRLPTVETEGSRHHPFNQGAYFSPLEEGIQQSRSVIAAMGEQTRSLNVDDTQVSSERRNFLANHYHTSQRLPTTETEGNVDGTQVLSERINFLANHYHTSQRLPTTVSEGNQRQRSLQVSRLLLQGAASFSSLSSALNSAMDSAERLVEDLEAYISSRNRRRSRQESSQTIDRDSLSRIAAVVQADSRNPDTAAEINSAVPPSAVSPGGPDVNAAVAYIENQTMDTTVEINSREPFSSSSSRRRDEPLEASDVDNGVSRASRRRRLR